MKKLVYGVVLLGLILVVSITKCAARGAKQMTVSEVEKEVRKSLPIGSSRSQVESYLEARKIRHKLGWQPIPEADGMIKLDDEHTEGALIVGARRTKTALGMAIRTDIKIQFKFDDTNSKLLDYTFGEVHTGP